MKSVASIRDARSADVDELATLYGSVLSGLRPLRGGALFELLDGRAEPASCFSVDVASPTVLVLVAERNAVLLGWSTVDWPSGSTAHAHIRELAVDPAARRAGIGSELFDATMAAVTTSGAEVVTAEVIPGDRASKNFFERCGLTARKIEVAWQRDLDLVNQAD